MKGISFRPTGRLERLAVAAPAALAVALYANTLWNGFAYDDVPVIQSDTVLHSLRGVPEIFRRPYWSEAHGGAKPGLYRPVTSTAFALQWVVWDGRPAGFHLGNVLLHALASALVAALLLRLRAGPGAALLGGAVFAAHPVHTEAVANAVGQAELLAATFALGALLLVRDPGAGRNRARSAAATLFYLLAILSKESAIVLPGLLLLLDGMQATGGLAGGRLRYRALLEHRAPLLLAWVAAAALAIAARWTVLGAPLGHDAPGALIHMRDDWSARFFTMVRVWPHYVRLLVAPVELSADYSPAVMLPAATLTPMGAFGLALGAALGAAALAARRRAPLLAGGLGWTALALLPVSNLLFPSGVLLAERTLYLPSAGVSLAVAGVWNAVRARRVRHTLAAGLGLWLAGAAAVVLPRNRVWKDSATVFQTLLRDHPESYKAHWVMGNVLAERGQWEESFEHYLEAARIWPHDPRLWAEIAARFLQRDQPAMAARAAERAVATGPGEVSGHELLALSRLRLQEWEAAAHAARRGLREGGPNPTLLYVLAMSLEHMGKLAEAAEALEESARLDPGAWQPWFHAAGLRARAGQLALAHAALDSAARYAAGDTAAYRLIHRYRQSLGRGDAHTPLQDRH